MQNAKQLTMDLLSQNSDGSQGSIPLNIKADVVLVTASIAKDWLSSMIPNQRNPSLATVNKYANEMKAGRWEVSSALSFNDQGHLIDGQHRLLAVIKSEVPTPFLIVGNLPSSAALKFDIGRSRTAVNIANLQGCEWVTNKHISTYKGMFISPTVIANIPLISHEETLEGVVKHREAIDFVLSRVHGTWTNACLTSVVARAYYSQNHKRLEEFLEVVTIGVCKNDDDSAASALREFWSRKSKDFSSMSSRRVSLVRITTNALRRFIKKSKVKSLQETTENYFPVKDFDQWWQDRYEDAA